MQKGISALSSQLGIQFEFIDQTADLERVTKEIQSTDRIAIDTEADSMHHYYAKVCLIQMAIGETYYIIDPLADLDLSPMLDALSQTELILHGADYDLRMLRQSFDFHPQKPIFDTMLAAQLLGFERFGLTSLVQELFEVTLTELGKRTDWSKRPLKREQLEYACNDTRFLQPMADLFIQKMLDLGRLEWHQESCAYLVAYTREDKPKDENEEWRIKGKRNLDRQQLAFLREIWYWREKEAQKADLPPFKIMQNQKLLELAKWAADHPRTPITKGPNIPRNCSGGRLKALQRALATANNLPRDQWPHHKKPKPSKRTEPYITQQIEAMVKQCGFVAEELGIAQPVLASRATIKAVVHVHPRSLEEMIDQTPLMRWQAEILYPYFEDVFEKYS